MSMDQSREDLLEARIEQLEQELYEARRMLAAVAERSGGELSVPLESPVLRDGVDVVIKTDADRQAGVYKIVAIWRPPWPADKVPWPPLIPRQLDE